MQWLIEEKKLKNNLTKSHQKQFFQKEMHKNRANVVETKIK